MINTKKLYRNYEEEPLKKYGKKIEDIPYDDLYELYINQNVSREEIGKYMNVSVEFVKKVLKKYNIKKPKLEIDKDKLYDLYIVKNMSRDEVAKYFGVGINTITVYCRKYGFEHKTQEQKYENYSKTIMKEHGVDNMFKLKEIKEKSKQTCKEKYGSEYYQMTDEFKNKISEANKKRK